MSTAPKDTIYIDIDDEITSIIEKVQDSKSKILALVLPKRAAVLQSTVNMRLLKRAAEEAKKSVVLITSEAALLPLAGAVGLHVARTMQTKPLVPPAPDTKSTALTITDDSSSAVEVDETTKLDPETPIGVLAGEAMPDVEEEESIEVDYDEDSGLDKGNAPKVDKDKKLKVPNFDRFRLLIILGGVFLVLLMIGSYWAFYIAPKAKIIVKTDNTALTSIVNLTASPSAKSLDKDKLIVPAVSKESKKTDTQKVPATGQKDNGAKATGTATLSLTDCSQSSVTIPAGAIISSNSLSFITQKSATLLSTIKGGKCSNDSDATASVAVVAQNGGDNYNLSARSYSVSGFSNVSASGTAMSGGTSKIVKIVSQQDFDTAKQQLLDRTKAAAVTDLTKQISDATMLALTDTVAAGTQSVTAAPNIGEEASETTVSIAITYNMLGMAQADLKQLIEANIKDKIDTTKQQIQESDDGLSKAGVKLLDKKANGDIPVVLQVQLTAGAKLDTVAIQKEVAGKKRGEAIAAISARPGVKDVTIQYSPFWVLSTPSKTSKITVVFEKADGSK